MSLVLSPFTVFHVVSYSQNMGLKFCLLMNIRLLYENQTSDVVISLLIILWIVIVAEVPEDHVNEREICICIPQQTSRC